MTNCQGYDRLSINNRAWGFVENNIKGDCFVKKNSAPSSTLNILAYDGSLATRPYYEKKNSLISGVKKYLTELRKERKVVLSGVFSLGEAEIIEHREYIHDGIRLHQIGTSFFKIPGSEQIFALILLDDETIRYHNPNEEWKYMHARRKPSVWQGTIDTEISIVPIVPIKGNIAVVRECKRLPKDLKPLCIKGTLCNMEIIGEGLVEDIICLNGSIQYSLKLLLFRYNQILYVRSEMLSQQYGGAGPFVEEAFITKLANFHI